MWSSKLILQPRSGRRWRWRGFGEIGIGGQPASKRVCLDSKLDDSAKSGHPWNANHVLCITLLPSLEKTQQLLKLYSSDPKGAKSDLLDQPDCPEFPNAEWKNILAGCAVNLDSVLSGYYSTSNNDEHIEILRDLEFKVPTVTPNKLVTTTGDWSVA